MRTRSSIHLSYTGFRNIIATTIALFFLVFFSTVAHAEQINLNQADAQTLEYIPGIGPAKAKEIIALRESSNGFSSIEDLLAVKGIGEKTLETIRQHGALDKGVSSLTEEMKNNPAKQVTNVGDTTSNSSG